LEEHRTFPSDILIQEIKELIYHNIQIGEADRARLAEILTANPRLSSIVRNELLARRAIEGRARNKNNIDELLSAMLGGDNPQEG
jgi:hypothetical protein